MAFKFSTVFRQELLSNASGGVREILNGGFIHIYSGTPPASADGEITGDLLATIYSDGSSAGLNFDAPAGSNTFIQKAAAQSDWNNATAGNVGTGTATHFIFVGPGAGNEDGDLSATREGTGNATVRILGNVGVAGSDLNLSNTSLTSGQTQEINSFNISIPESLGFS